MDHKGMILYQTVYESPVGVLTLTALEDALAALSFPKERYPKEVERLKKECEVCTPDADKTPRILKETRESSAWRAVLAGVFLALFIMDF